MTKASISNGIRHVSATGGSTNFVMHVMAIARAAGLEMDLKEFDAIQESVPVVAKFKPSSQYNMTDYHRAGGVAASLRAIRDYLDLDVPMAFDGTMRELVDRPAPPANPAVIHPVEDALSPAGCFTILHGNLAPQGAVVKKTGVDPKMYYHRGPAGGL